MEPILISIAAAAAGKATEAAVKSGGAAVKKAAELVRRRFAGKPELEQAEQGRIGVEEFAEAIYRACATDDEFRERLGEAAGTRITVSKFHNEFHGDVKNVVQAERIENLRLD
ncbi:hypothetical protein [Glycomyces salinus]|uniref:hypothetical protein n=1 Tax=Glycomyces salinus TaxID=980294 RepID=UPI0018EC6270|nr:hypothetical protein [Glycomyces salinus]